MIIQNLFRKGLFSFVLIIGVGLLVLLAAVVNLIFVKFTYLLEIFFKTPNIQLILAWPATLGLMTVSFALLYKIFSDVRVAWWHVWLGAFTAALIMILACTFAPIYFSFSPVGSALEAVGAFSVLVIAICIVAQIFLLDVVIARVPASEIVFQKPCPKLVTIIMRMN